MQRIPSIDPKGIGERIKGLRSRAELTQFMASGQLGIDAATLSRLEAGDLPMTIELLHKLCDFYNVKSDVILGF